MADDELGLYLGGELRAMDANALATGVQALLTLLGRPSGGRRADAEYWALSKLYAGSAGVAVRPGGAKTQESVDRMRVVLRGIARLERAPGEPEGWGPTDLVHLLELGRLVGMRGIAGVSLTLNGDERRVDLTAGILDNARASLAEEYVSIGSVHGHLDRYSGRGPRPTVGLREEGTGRNINITYPNDMQGEMLRHLEQDVVVWGEIRRNAEGLATSVEAAGIDGIAYEPPEPIEHLTGLFGPDWTGGEDSVDFVHRQRRD